jgi:hypothetical protein
MTCPYDHKIPCAYLESKDPIVFNCCDCKVYKKNHRPENGPPDGVQMLGCLAIGIVILCVIGYLFFKLIQYLR